MTALLLWLPRLLVFGPDILRGGNTLFTGDHHALAVVLSLVDLGFSVWGTVLLCNTVAEVQGFRSAWMGLGNLIVSGLVIGLPLILLVIAFGLLMRVV